MHLDGMVVRVAGRHSDGPFQIRTHIGTRPNDTREHQGPHAVSTEEYGMRRAAALLLSARREASPPGLSEAGHLPAARQHLRLGLPAPAVGAAPSEGRHP